VLSLIYLAGSAWVGLAGAALAAFRCDESCFNEPGSGDWRYDSTAWQWSAAGYLGGVVFVLAVVTVIAAAHRFARFALVTLGVQVAAVAALLLLIDPRWRDGGAFAGVAIVGLCGLAIARRRLLERIAGVDAAREG
jgi:hypothetical protein